MITKSNLLLSTIMCFALCNCIEKIDLELGKDPILIVDGMITDEPGPYTVKIDFSAGFNENPLFVANNSNITGATVRIEDDEGNDEILVEDPNNTGSYSTQSSGMRGEVGRTYQLFITLKDGSSYQSSPETILPVSSIDNIDVEIDEVDILNSSNAISTQELIKLFVEFKDPAETNNFYRWRYQEVYEYIAPLAEQLQAIRDALPPPTSEFPPPPLPPIIRQCWVTSFDNEFLNILDDNLFNGDLVSRHEVVSIVPDRKFLTKYSILVKQYSMTERAYTFFNNIGSQVENTGTIFETSNFQIQGNISSANDAETIVLGYFGASAVTSKRIFLDKDQLGIKTDIPEYDCSPGDDGTTPISCEDCTKFPGTSTDNRPDYWPI